MLLSFFSFLVNYPKRVFLSITFLALLGGFYTPLLDIDASSESLMLNHDKDLNFARKMSKRFKTSDFLVVTYTPDSPLLSKKSLENLKKITKEFKSLKKVQDVISILNVPLLESPKLTVKELTKPLPTLFSKTTDKALAKREFLNSPLYKNSLVSEDFKTTAIIINLKNDEKYMAFVEKRNALENDDNSSKDELKKIESEFKAYRHQVREKEHQNIEKIRQIIKENSTHAKLFLGGVSMISDDMITYVKSDVVLYGTSLLVLLILSLGVIFRQAIWVFVPIVVCIYSLIITTGILGFFGYEITVISSNFISLQLIITLSIILHLIVQFQEYNQTFQQARQKRLVFATLLSKVKPSFFAIITTIAGFSSLVFSGIKPIVNLGIMMSIGIGVSLVVAFLLFASIVSQLKKLPSKKRLSSKFSFTHFCSNFTLKHGNLILIISFLVLIIGVYGSSKLQVENSFISYFKSSTDIYKGMKIIDEKLGGTTPLDVIVTFKEQKQKENSGEFGSFEDEFDEEAKSNKYWFNREKIEVIKSVGKYLNSLKELGSVQSINNILQIGKNLNDGKELDSFALALIYNEMPDKYKKLILSPYVNIENNQLRFFSRVVDSNPNLRRDDFLKKVKKDLDKIVPSQKADVRLSSFMVLYNNMLQSLYKSQIVTLGFVVLMLSLMFWALFRSLKVATIALVSNLIPMSLVFGFMGLAGIPLDMMSITIAAISIGIGVDDTIHYIHRFKHEYLHVKDYKQAMINSHKTIGYAMFYTSFTIVLGFGILVVSNFIPTIYFGLLTVCVMILVLLGALLLLPKLLLVVKPFGR